MNKTCGGIIILLLLVIGDGIYKFIFHGSTSPSTAGRSSIHLNPDERDLVLTEMRAFLGSVQKITQGVDEDDMQLVHEYARLADKVAPV